MKNIILIRHGKASQDYDFKDFDRPLLSLGIENSKRIAIKFSDLLQEDSTLWSSSSKRTSETAFIFAKCWNIDTNRINFKDVLYTFEALVLEQIIKSCPNEVKNLIIFGHNSAITDFVNKFGDNYIDNVPTSGLVSIKFETDDWKLILNGKTIKTLFPSQF
jgi:phosphohistidine phosphatase